MYRSGRARLAQDEEPGVRGGDTGGRGGLGPGTMKVARNTKRTVPTLDVQSICDISERAFWDGVEILTVIEVLETGNQTRVQKAINKGDVRFAADVIKNALFTHLILLVARAHGGKGVWAGDRHAGMAFEQLKRFPKIAKEMQSPSPTDVADARYYGINAGAITAERLSSTTGINISLTSGKLTKTRQSMTTCLISREPPRQLSKS